MAWTVPDSAFISADEKLRQRGLKFDVFRGSDGIAAFSQNRKSLWGSAGLTCPRSPDLHAKLRFA